MEKKGSGFLFGMIVGCFIGAAIAILLVPQTGEEARCKLKEGLQEGKEKLKGLTEDLKESMEGLIEKGREAFQLREND